MSSPQNNPRSPYQIWLLAIRPRTLPAAAAPVIVGSALAWQTGSFLPGPALAALLTALLLQIGANLANDVFDFYKGADTSARQGPIRVTQAGLLSPQQVLFGMWLTFSLAALLGLYLYWVAGWPVLLLGLSAILAALAYTGGPLPYGYYGLGEFFVFLFFGVAAVTGTYYVQAQSLSLLVFLSSIPIGLLITAILVVNNLRDLETDQATGKKTLAVRFGVRGTRLEYLLCLVGAYLVPLILWMADLTTIWILLTWISLPYAFYQSRIVYKERGRPLNKALGGTGILALVFAFLFSLGLVLG